ncbi:MAG: hypothetical protein HAW66_07595 [Shewanella sp.]|nr:hypothetical protein [Shewanella sp.]
MAAAIPVAPPMVPKFVTHKVNSDYNVKPKKTQFVTGSKSYTATLDKPSKSTSASSSFQNFHANERISTRDKVETQPSPTNTTHKKIKTLDSATKSAYTTPKEALDKHMEQRNRARHIILDRTERVDISDLHTLINFNYSPQEIESVLTRMQSSDTGSIDELHSGKTALHLTCENGSLELVKVLLSHNADVMKTDDNHLCAKQVAIKHNHLSVLKIILENSRSICEVSDIHVLIKMECDIHFIQYMLSVLKNDEDSNSDIDKKINGKTALDLAREMKKYDVAAALIHHGAQGEISELEKPYYQAQDPNTSRAKKIKMILRLHSLRPSSSSSQGSSRRNSTSVSEWSELDSPNKISPSNSLDTERCRLLYSGTFSITRGDLHSLIESDVAADYIYQKLTQRPDGSFKSDIPDKYLNKMVDGLSALELAWTRQNHGIILALVAAGADTSIPFSCKKNLKQLLFQAGHHDLLKIILNQTEAIIEFEDLKTIILLGWELGFFKVAMTRVSKCNASFPSKINLSIDGKPLLEYAYDRGEDTFIYELITADADLDTPFSCGKSLKQILLKNEQHIKLRAVFDYPDTKLTCNDLKTIIDLEWDIDLLKRALTNIKKFSSSYNTSINQKLEGKTLLEHAWLKGKETIVYALISAGADLERPFSEGKNLKQLLFDTQQHSKLKELLTFADTPVKCSDLHTFIICKFGRSAIRKAVIRAKTIDPSLNLETRVNEKTILERACENNDQELIVELIALGTDVMTPFSNGNMIQYVPLELLTSRLKQHRPINCAIIAAFIKLGCNLQCIQTYLQEASQTILDNELNINERVNGKSLLELAWKNRDHNLILVLINAGANISLPFTTKLNLKQTLKLALQFKLLETFLSIPSTSVEPEDLFTAIEQDWSQSLLISILDRGKSIPKVYDQQFHSKFIDVKNKQKQSAIELACKAGNIKAVTTLLEHGADNDPYCSTGFSLMHIAAQQNHLALLQLLDKHQVSEVVIFNGSALYQFDTSHCHTPLHLGLLDGDHSMRSYLIAVAGEQIFTLKNKDELTPFDLLESKMDEDQIALLFVRSAASQYQKFIEVKRMLKQSEDNLHKQSNALAILEISSQRHVQLPKPAKWTYEEVDVAYDTFFSNPKIIEAASKAKVSMLEEVKLARTQTDQLEKTQKQLMQLTTESKSKNDELTAKIAELEAKTSALEAEKAQMQQQVVKYNRQRKKA